MSGLNTATGRLRGALKSFAYSGPLRDRWQQPDRVMQTAGVQRGQRVADLGAGGGYFTYRLAQAVGTEGVIYAVDPDEDMTARIQRRAARSGYTNIRAMAPNEEGPVLPEPVDLVLIVDSFHHLPPEPTYYESLAERLAEGGQVAIIEARPRWYLLGHATAPDRIRSVLVEAGYRLVGDYDFLRRQSFMVFDRAPS